MMTGPNPRRPAQICGLRSSRGLTWLAAATVAAVGWSPPGFAQEPAPQEYFIDVGSEGDDDLIVSGISHREGPVDDMGPVFDATFRWCEDAFTLKLPVFAGAINHVSVRMRVHSGHRLLVEADGEPVAVARSTGDHQLSFLLPPGVIRDRETVMVTFRAPVILGPASERDTRILYGPLDWVRVRPMRAPGVPESANALTIEIGDPGDEAFLADGFYGREGPYDGFGDFYRDTFRWARPGFAVRLPIFPGSDNVVFLLADISGAEAAVTVMDGERKIGPLVACGTHLYCVSLTGDQVGRRRSVVLSFQPTGDFESANPRDSRRLFCALREVTVVGDGEAGRVGPDLPSAHNLAVAGYSARRRGQRGEAPSVTITPRIAFSPDSGRKLPAQLQQEAAVLLANGCTPVIWDEDAGSASSREAQETLDAFVAPRRDTFIGTEPVHYVGVVEPRAYRIASGAQALGTPEPPRALLYAVELLSRLHYPSDVLSDSAELDTLAQYALIVVPSLPWYSRDLWPKLREYVAGGGAVLVAGSASLMRDERKALTLELGDVLGVQATGRSQGSCRLPAGGYFANVGTAQLVRAHTAEQLLPLYASDRPGGEIPEAAGLALNHFGEGTGVYIAGEPFASAARRMDPLVLDVIRQALAAAIPQPMVELDGPATVELSLRASEHKVVAHLVNRTQHADYGGHPAYVEEVLPVGPVVLRLRVDRAPSSVVEMPGKRELEVSYEEGVATVRIPVVHIHTAVVYSDGS